MPDCYVCGHPVLEGQKSEVIYTGSEEPVEENPDPHTLTLSPVVEHIVHANPADHLPTLGRSGPAGAVAKFSAMQERERAARLVMEEELPLDWFLSSIEQEAAEAARLKLAQRIREGE